MIQIEDVSFRYSNSKDDALEHINLHIRQGEFVVLVGSSGCGKTTITRLINRLVPEFFEGKLEGKVYIDGQDTSDLDIQDLAGIVGSVFQDPRSQFFATDTTAEIAFSCENVGLPREELCRRIEKQQMIFRLTACLNGVFLNCPVAKSNLLQSLPSMRYHLRYLFWMNHLQI